MPLHVVFTGWGAPEKVVFLHGFMGDHRDWRPVMARLRGQADCMAINLPGHGKSLTVGSEADCSIPAMAEAVLGALERLNVGRCHLAGYSMGGRVAMQMAMTAPERFNRLVLESASPGLQTEAERSERAAHDEQWAQELELHSFARFLERWYAQPLFASLKRDNERYQALLLRRLENSPAMLAMVLRGASPGTNPPLWERLGELALPVLHVVGALDPKYLEIAQRMAQYCPDYRAEIVDDAGHAVHIEQPRTFAEHALRFMGIAD